MAGGIGLPPRAERPWPHDWYSYKEYQVVHASHMERPVQEGIVLRDTLSYTETRDRVSGELVAVRLHGRLQCIDDVLVRVEKRMAVRRGVNNRYEVRTAHYQYHAWVRGRSGRTRRDLIRIDTNPHRAGLHAHLFDEHGKGTASPDLPLEDMPTLDAFVRHVAAENANP